MVTAFMLLLQLQVPSINPVREVRFPSDSITRILCATVGTDGTLYFSDFGTRVLHVIKADTAYSFGRRGSGPQEFRYPFVIGIMGDSVWVVDASLLRITILNRRADSVRSVMPILTRA